MARGRKRIPTSIHKLRGNPSHLNLNAPDVPEYSIEIPPAPSHLDKFARKEWDRVTLIMLANETITALDLVILANYCQTHSDLVRNILALRKEKEFIKSERSGLYHPNPRLAHIAKLKNELRLYASELGFTPASRSKVSKAGGARLKGQRSSLAQNLFGKVHLPK